jgi:hypothetical protein
MAAIGRVTAEITATLPCFGLRVTRAQAAAIASQYFQHRPTTTAWELAASLLAVADFQWGPEADRRTRRLIMRSLVEHLDAQYFVATFEHEGPSAE